jgi:hypothetical protein
MHYEISKPKQNPSCCSMGNNPERPHGKIIDYIYLRLTTFQDYHCDYQFVLEPEIATQFLTNFTI